MPILLFTPGCVPFSYMPPQRLKTPCYFSRVSHGETRKAFSALREVRGDRQSGGQNSKPLISKAED